MGALPSNTQHYLDLSLPWCALCQQATLCTPEAQELARDGAIQGSTLLKNANGTLPLHPRDFVAVVGPNANLSHTMAYYYFGHHGCVPLCNGPQGFHNLADAVAQYATAGVTTVQAIPDCSSTDISGVAEAAAASEREIQAR